MRLKFNYLIFYIVGFLAFLWMFIRYIDLKLPLDKVILFYCGANLILVLIGFSIFYFKTALNPLLFYSLYLFLFFFSLLPFSSFYNEISDQAISIILFSIFSFIFGASLKLKFNVKRLTLRFDLRSKLFIFYILVLLNLLAFFYEIYLLKYIPILSIGNRDVYGDFHKYYTPLVNSFILLSSVIPIWALILYKGKLIPKSRKNIILVLAIFILINHFGRSMFLIFSLVWFSYLYYYNKIKIRGIIISAISFVLFFFTVGYLRMGMINRVEEGHNIIRHLGGVKYKTNLLETYLVLYSSIRFYTFDLMVQDKSSDNFYGFGSYTFRPIFSITPLKKAPYFNQSKFDSLKKLATYAIEPFLDFGILGVIFINIIYGIISVTIFNNFKNRNGPVYIVIFGAVLYCFMTLSFTNSFNLFFIWMVSFINGLILK